MSRLSEAAGVSLSTVSHLLNGTRRVSESTRAAVLEAAAQIGFEDPRLERVVRPTRLVGVVLPSAASPYFAELLEGMGTEAVRKDIGLLMMTSSEDPKVEQRAVELLTARGVDGLAIIPTAGFTELSRPMLRHKEHPVVLVDRIDVEGFDGVGGENVNASVTLVHHLLSLGHRRVGLIRGLGGLMTTAEREHGYRQAHEHHGVAVDESLVVDGFSTAPGGRDAMERLVHLTHPPTAVFCTNNNMTVGSWAALQRLGVSVPDEMALVAFDDTEWSGLVEPGITCMAQPFHAMGIHALDALLARIADPDLAFVSTRMSPSYEHRGSCGCRSAATN